QRLDRLALIERLRPVARLDQLRLRAMRELEDVRIEGERRQDEANRQQRQAESLRSLAITSLQSRREERDEDGQRERKKQRAIDGGRFGPRHQDQVRDRPAGDHAETKAPPASRDPPRQICRPEHQYYQRQRRGIPDDEADLEGGERVVPGVERKVEEIERRVRDRVGEQRVVRGE